MLKFLLALFLMTSFALAKEKNDYKSLYKESKKGLEIEIAADPAAYAMLAVRQEIMKRHRQGIDETLKEYKETLKNKEEPRYSYEVTYTTQWASDNLLSILGSVYSFSGGAHGNTDFQSFFYDLQAKRNIDIKEILPDIAKPSPLREKLFNFIMLEIAKQKFRDDDENKDKPKPTNAQLLAIIKEDFFLKDKTSNDYDLSAFTLKGQGSAMPSRTKATAIKFHYPHYVMGAYAEGIFEVEVPVSLFREGIAERFKGFFE